MEKKQERILAKEFKVNDKFSITRRDYEWFPCAMLAWNWTDEQMAELAKNIAKELENYTFAAENEDDEEDTFYREMENVAVRMGMKYYDDLNDGDLDELEMIWNGTI